MAEAQTRGRAEVEGILSQDNANPRAAVHSFDPDASPEEKAAQAGKPAPALKSVKERADNTTALAVDTGNNGTVIPTITIEEHGTKDDAAKSTSAAGQVLDTGDEESVPGAMPDAPIRPIPDWYKMGWRAVGGIDDEPLTEQEEKDKGVLDAYLGEQYYGAWYHNAALIVVAVFASHFLTRFGFGWGWLFIVLAFCCTYYSTSMERVRRAAKDDIQRELVKTRLMSEHESADWINNFLDRFWLIYEPVLARTIVSSVDQVLSTNTPAFLDSLRLTDFTLGTKAPRIDKVRTFPKTPDDVVMMDWGLSFTPNDISDITPKQAANKVNPKVVLSVRVGKGLATAAMPILVEDISFSGLMRIRLKLMTSFPHVQVVDICFLEKPVIDYVLKPIGGETFGFDIANIPGLASFIREMTHATLGPMMYDPNVFTLNLEQLLSGTPLDTAVGVLQVTIHSARGLKGNKIGGGTPDPFVSLSIENRAEVAHTKYKKNTHNPTWVETKFLLINNLNETLNFSIQDFNDHRKNTAMGDSSFELSRLHDDAEQEGVVSPILKDGKERGELRYDLSWYPIMQPEEGSEELADSSVGIVRLTIHQAKELDTSKSMAKDLNPFAEVLLGGKEVIHQTPRFKHTTSPVWESAKEFLCSDRESSVVTVKVIDDRDFMKDPVIGYMSIHLQQLLDAKKEARDWWPLSGCKSGKLRVSAEWKPLNMAGSLHGASKYTPPIGVVRLHLIKAVDVKNVEATLGGKSDPYVRVMVGNVTKGRTEVVNNNLSPVWDQIVYIPVHSLKQSVFLECMDYQHLTKDRSLGWVELHVDEIAEKTGEIGEPYRSKGVKEAQDPIRLDKGSGFKGHLHYTAQFVPSTLLEWQGFSSHEANPLLSGSGNKGYDTDAGTINSKGSVSSSDEEAKAIPTGVTIGPEKKKKHHKAKSTDTTKTTDTVDTSGTTTDIDEPSPVDAPGVVMPKDELLKQQSGIIILDVVSGQLRKKARLEVCLDDGYWPAFSTVKARSTQMQWDYVGEGFIKELDFGQVWLRLNEAAEGDKDDIIAQWKGNAKEFLESTLERPTKYRLHDENDEHHSTVEIEARYVPVPVKLDPRESINNMGILRVELLDGKDLAAADRGGKSDPYAVFSLNDNKVHKSQTKKKTLNPEWQENFVVNVPSRVAANFEIEVFDWDQVGRSDSLGKATINLADLEPFQASEQRLLLNSSKFGQKGAVRVRLLFQPEIIARSRQKTSTFSAAGRAMTQFGGIPVGAGKGVFHGAKKVFGRGGNHTDEEDERVPNIAPGQASHPVGPGYDASEAKSAFPTDASSNGAPQQPGTLRVTVLEAKDIAPGELKAHVVLRLGDKEHKTKHSSKSATPEWNETFNFTAGSLTPKLYAWIYEHKTLGKDKQLGEAEIDIWRHVKTSGVSAADVSCEMRSGTGMLKVRIEFDSDSRPAPSSSSGSSISDGDRVHRTLSIPSPSRFSLHKRRASGEHLGDRD
ncbi:C2 domain-containing protein [Pterulicium gracile]|uniref:C2 domain-containing protein n=1 Tax=Pterulicium gracile TaxID=1884261 RepID=A0A5C3QWA1_9AGAR|nr:C2 domain-containing protein [Pterula gracilis]